MGIIKKLLGRPDHDDFARLMTDFLRESGEERDIRYDPESFKLIIGEEDRVHFWLGNAYTQYLAAPRKMRRAVLERFAVVPAANAEIIPSSFDEASSSLLPRVRDLGYYAMTKLRFEVEGLDYIEPPFKPLASHLAVGLAYDRPESIVEITRDALERWERSFDEALEIARDNLWNMSGGKFEQIAPGVYLSPWQDNHDASRLYLYDLLWHLDIDGDVVAVIPNRDTLLVTGSESAEGLRVMAAICEEVTQQSHPISAIPVILREKQWETFTLDSSHPAFEPFNKLRIFEEARDYAEQKKWLEALNSKREEDVFVASYTVLQDKRSGALMSYSVWVEDIPTLLPITDEVVFMRDRKIIAKAAWEQVRRVAGSLMSVVDLYPRRYRIDMFPTEEQLKEIGLFTK
ncbi:MAG: hypothetical protein AB1631_03980 [Acidobacteriota bacterium]